MEVGGKIGKEECPSVCLYLGSYAKRSIVVVSGEGRTLMRHCVANGPRSLLASPSEPHRPVRLGCGSCAAQLTFPDAAELCPSTCP